MSARLWEHMFVCLSLHILLMSDIRLVQIGSWRIPPLPNLELHATALFNNVVKIVYYFRETILSWLVCYIFI